jgi:hypothetical protein
VKEAARSSRKEGFVRKTVMLTLVLIVSAVCLPAQDAGKPSDKTSDLTTIEGCLRHSEGQYTLIDDTNTIHHLVGGAKLLTHHIGHQVEITGKPGTRTLDTTPAGVASAAVVQATIEVKSVKHIADTCKSAGE